MKRHNLGSYFFLLALGAYAFFEARKLEIGRVSNPGAGFFPFWLSVGLIIVSGTLIIRSAFGKREPSPATTGQWSGLAWKKSLWVLAILFLYAFLLETLGYTLSTFLLMFFLFRTTKSKSWIMVIAGSLFVSLSTYLLFKQWLQVQFPAGILGI